MTYDRKSRSDLVHALESAGATFRGATQCFCPFHQNTDTPAGNIHQFADGTWKFKCFAGACTPKAMDVFDVVSKHTGKELKDVLPKTNGHNGNGYHAHADNVRKSPQPEAPPAEPKVTAPTANALSRRISEGAKEKGNRCEVFAYDGMNGEPLELVFRIDIPGGKKQFLQASPHKDGWALKAPPKPWPLYRMAKVAAASEVYVVEGEKCVHALENAGVVATTSPGGAKNGQNADWSILAGKKVILWPDNDEPGIAHMQGIANTLKDLEPRCQVFWIDPSDIAMLEPGGDVADILSEIESREEKEATVQTIASAARRLGALGGYISRIHDIIAGRRVSIKFPHAALSRLSQALLPGTVTLLGGNPGSSKSFFVLDCLPFWESQGIKVAFYALEDDAEYQLGRIVAQRGDESHMTDEEWIARNGPEALAKIESLMPMLERLEHVISGAPDGATFDDVAEWAEKKAKAGARVLIIDPVSVISPKDAKISYNEERLFMRKLASLGTRYQCSFILTIHGRKGQKDASGRVALEDFAGGSSYPRLAHTVFWLHFYAETMACQCSTGRPGESAMKFFNRHIFIAKARNGSGTGRVVAFQFSSGNLTMEEQGIIIGIPRSGLPKGEEDQGNAAREWTSRAAKRKTEQGDFSDPKRGHDQ